MTNMQRSQRKKELVIGSAKRNRGSEVTRVVECKTKTKTSHTVLDPLDFPPMESSVNKASETKSVWPGRVAALEAARKAALTTTESWAAEEVKVSK